MSYSDFACLSAFLGSATCCAYCLRTARGAHRFVYVSFTLYAFLALFLFALGLLQLFNLH